MQGGVLEEILEWSEDRPGWQRDALRRLFTAGLLAPADIDDLLDLCKAAHGLSNPRSPQPLAKEHLAIKDTGAATVSLLTLTHNRGVNALAPNQTISFGPQLTIAYGQNGAGKSGYTRILKRACRSRSTEEILGNVLSGDTPLRGQATLRFRVGIEEREAVWTQGAAPPGALASVSVFDSHSAPVYIREKTDVAFRPFGLDVFDKLSTACASVRDRLEREQSAISTSTLAFPTMQGGTKVASLLASLTSLTKAESVHALATFSEGEERRLAELRERQQDFQSSDPRRRAQELGLKANRADLVSSHVAGLTRILGNTGLEALQVAARALRAAKDALALLREKVFTPGLLPGTGEEKWRKMWDAATEYSGVAYPKEVFPAITEGAQCVLCQQAISAEGANRLRHFQEFVLSTAQEEVRRAEFTHEKLLSSVAREMINRDDVTGVIQEIEADDTELAKRVQLFLQEAEHAQQAIRDAMAQGKPLPTTGPTVSPESDLRMLSKALRDRADQLRTQGSTMDDRDAAELKELEARASLRVHVQAVLHEIERKQRLAAYTLCIEDTSTKAITRKSTDLTTRLVTKRLHDEFQAELTKLEFTHLAIEIRTAGGAKGALFHQLAFTNAPGVQVAHILSEGESRTLSLAAFLTELSTAPASSAIIFDDPVSSLDHVWRQRIARRLALEARSRQVIVFTHDMLFVRLLLDECERLSVQFLHQYIRRDGTGSGICSPDLPWVAMRVKERLGILRARWQAAEKASRTDGPDGYEREGRDIYGLLREAWEHAVGEILLNDVLERYRPSIETKKVRHLHDITEEDCAAVEAAMTECSRWIRGHDHPPADGTPFPKPDDLKKLIQDLDDWIQRIRKRREGKKSP